MPKTIPGVLYKISTSIRKLIVLLLLGLTCASSQQNPANAHEMSDSQKTKSNGGNNLLLVKQKSDKLGASELYISDRGVKFIARNGDFVAMCAAPSWRAVIYSKSRNIAYSCSHAEMNQKTLKLFNHPPAKRAVVSHNPYKSLNLHIRTITEDGKLEPKGSDDSLLFQQRKHKAFSSIRFSCADQVPIEPQVQDFLNWLFNADHIPGIPLELTRNYTDGSHETQYETISMSKAPESANFFTYPNGYNRTPKPIDIFIREDPRSTLEDLFISNHD